jgi:hypothetical protein
MAKVQQYHDPQDLRRVLAGKAAGFYRVLGVDLGTNCGMAWTDVKAGMTADDAVYHAGQLSLDLGPYDTGPLRHIRLKQFLSVACPDLIGYEEVKHTPDVKGFGGKRLGIIVARVATAAELLGGFKITLATWAEEHGIPVQGYSIGAIKKFATGKGNAGKPAMITAASTRFGVDLDPDGYESTGADNIADALWICQMTVATYATGLCASR